MDTVLDGVYVSATQCVCVMSYESDQKVTVTAECTQPKACVTTSGMVEYSYLETSAYLSWLEGMLYKLSFLISDYHRMLNWY